MTAGRWAQVEAIVIDALERPASARRAFLDEACAGDEALRQEVESLVGYDGAAQSFLAQPALEEAARITATDESFSATDWNIAGYTMSSLLGAGGMGEVYRARDVRLERDVAIKVVPAMPGDQLLPARFEEEARAASGLNHPNIVTIYSVGSHDDAAYIVMELVSGRTLRALLADRPLPVPTTLDVAAQIADGLAAAHAAGVVHRDLKPENVMLTPDGLVKILDFGIAKRERRVNVSGSTQARVDATATTWSGTAGYMAPEQAEHRPVDHRADQFSFGAIVYEMLTGRRAVEQDSITAMTRAVINPQVGPVPTLPGREVASLWRIVERCLSKDPVDRYHDTGELAQELRRVRDEFVFAARRSQMTRRRALSMGGLAVLSVAAGTAWIQLRAPAIRRLAILPLLNPLGDESTEALCDGITEVLIRQLSRMTDLAVIARSTVFQFRGKPHDPTAVGRQLQVDAVLAGSVLRRGERARVEVELVNASTGAHIWGDVFNRPEADVLAIQDDIAATIIRDGLGAELSAPLRRELTRSLTPDARAYALFLRAVHYFRRDTEADYLTARQLLTEAVARDPSFALGHLTLASTYSVMATDGFERPRTAWLLSSEHVTRALEHDPELPDAHAERATRAFFFDWDWAAAQRAWDLALRSRRAEIQAELLTSYVLQQWALGRTDDALRFARAARAIDPLSLMLAVREADLLAHRGDLTAAADLYMKIIAESPADPRAHFGLVNVRRLQQRFDEAIDAWRNAYRAVGDDDFDAAFSDAHGRDGYRRVEQRAAMYELENLGARADAEKYVSPLDVARAHARLGDAERAFAFLDQAFDERAPGLVFLNVDRAWDNMRADSRFDRARRRVGLPVTT